MIQPMLLISSLTTRTNISQSHRIPGASPKGMVRSGVSVRVEMTQEVKKSCRK